MLREPYIVLVIESMLVTYTANALLYYLIPSSNQVLSERKKLQRKEEMNLQRIKRQMVLA